MRICWRLGRCTVRDVLEEDLKGRTRDYRTILTFMTRMAKKGWLRLHKVGNTNHYSPAVAQDKAVLQEIELFRDAVIDRQPENLELLRKTLG